MLLDAPNLSHSTLICKANSLVGANTNTIGPSPRCKYGCNNKYKIHGKAMLQHSCAMAKVSSKILSHFYLSHLSTMNEVSRSVERD
jgi:hypothetical protein